MTACGYHVQTSRGEPAYVVRAGVLQMPDGTRRLMPAGCSYIKPVHFDQKVDDWRLVEHWATVRLGRAEGGPEQTVEQRELRDAHDAARGRGRG